MIHIALIVLVYLAIGAFAGTMSGLLGIGGGLIVVPTLLLTFRLMGMPADNLMHMAAGTSLAIMIFTTGRSFLAHRKHHPEFGSIFKLLLPGVIVGAVSGGVLAHFLHSDVLKIIFGVLMILIAIKLFFPIPNRHAKTMPSWKVMSSAGFIVGLKSGLLGIGGGAITVPFLTFCNVPIRRAVLVSLATGLTVAVIGTIVFTISGLTVPDLPPWTLGYIYIPAWVCVAAGSLTFAPLGTKLSHWLPVKSLKTIFAVCLVIVGVRMLFF